MKRPSLTSRTTDTIAVLFVGVAMFVFLFLFNQPIDTAADWALFGGILSVVSGLFLFRDLRWVFINGWSYGPSLRASHILRLPVSVLASLTSSAVVVAAFVVTSSTMLYVVMVPTAFMLLCLFWQPFNHLEKSDVDWRNNT